MAMNTNTVGSFLLPFKDQPDDYTPSRIDVLQTQGAALATLGVIGIYASATANNDFHLYSLHLSIIPQTTTSVVDVMFDETTIASLNFAAWATLTGHFIPITFPITGLTGGTTTTLTTYLNVRTASATVTYVAVGGRNT